MIDAPSPFRRLLLIKTCYHDLCLSIHVTRMFLHSSSAKTNEIGFSERLSKYTTNDDMRGWQRVVPRMTNGAG